MNGDSRTDFLISAAGSNTVFVISGADGSALQTYGGLSLGGLAFGYHDYVARVADQDGDSKADALVGGSNVVRLYSTGTGNMLLELTGSDFYGAGVGSPGDIVGDGLPELLIAAIEDDTNGTNSGLVDIVRLAPQDVVSYCVAAPNSAGAGALMGAVGSTSLSINDLALTATGAPPGQNGIFYYGSQPAQNPFGNGFGCIGGPPVVRLLPVVTIDPSGAAMRALDFTAPPLSSGPGQVLTGSTWRFQFWYRDTAGGGSGFNLPDGLEATFSI